MLLLINLYLCGKRRWLRFFWLAAFLFFWVRVSPALVLHGHLSMRLLIFLPSQLESSLLQYIISARNPPWKNEEIFFKEIFFYISEACFTTFQDMLIKNSPALARSKRDLFSKTTISFFGHGRTGDGKILYFITIREIFEKISRQ